MILSIVLLSLVLLFSGCRYAVRLDEFLGDTAMYVLMLGSGEEFSQQGETEAEGRRRHLRYRQLSRQQFIEDLDMVFLTDEPSKLTDKRMR